MHAENGVWLTIAALLVWDVQWPDASPALHAAPAPAPAPNLSKRAAGKRAVVVPAASQRSVSQSRYVDSASTLGVKPGSAGHVALQQRFELLKQTGEAERVLRIAWQRYNGVHAYGVDWARLGIEDLAAIVGGVNSRTISSIVEALILNPEECKRENCVQF